MALLVCPALADPVIEVTRQSEGSYQLTLEVDEAIGLGEGQQLLLPTAVQLCDGRPPQFGRYQFSQTEAVEVPGRDESFVLVQDIDCRTGPEEQKPPSRALGEQERLQIEQVAQGRAEACVKGLGGEDYGASYAMLSDFIASTSPFERWRVEQDEFRERAGPLRSVDVWKVTVYVDPPGVPEPGIYVATDLEASYENLLMCGYFMWLEGSDMTLRILRQEVGHLDAAVVSRMSQSQLAKVKSDFHCRD